MQINEHISHNINLMSFGLNKVKDLKTYMIWFNIFLTITNIIQDKKGKYEYEYILAIANMNMNIQTGIRKQEYKYKYLSQT